MWITPAESDIAATLSAGELAIYKTAQLQVGQSNPLTNAIDRTVSEVRGYVAGCRNNRLGADGTIPEECLAAFCDLAAWRAMTRMPINDKSMLDTRRTKMEDAIKFLKDVSACKFAVAQPTTESSESIVRPSMTQHTGNDRQATREKMSGL